MSDKLPHVEVHESICKSIGDIAKENQALKQRIKRLVKAGDAVFETRSCECQYEESAFYCRSCTSAWAEWEEAKEAKP